MSLPAYKNSALPAAERIEDLLSRMTLEEKAGQLNQWYNLGPDQYDQVRSGEIGSGLLANSSTAGNDRQERVFAKAINEIQTIAVTQSRLGIPLIFGRDVIHGYRTVAPIPLGMAATWAPELIEAANTIAAQRSARRRYPLGVLAHARYRPRPALGPRCRGFRRRSFSGRQTCRRSCARLSGQ